VETLGLALAMFAVGCVIAHCAGGCAPTAKVPAYCANEEAFIAAVLRCTDKSATRAESRECKRQLQASCGFVETVTDGGAK
jgi:hypothetical protein